MKNPFATIDLEQEIVSANTATLAVENLTIAEQHKLDQEAAKVQQEKIAGAYKDGLLSELGFDYELAEARRIRQERDQFAALPQNRIMSIEAIKAVCLKYELRFLPTRFYKGALDAGIAPAVAKVKDLLKELPAAHTGEQLLGYNSAMADNLKGKPQFCIAAPSEAFALQPRPKDPLLFLRLNAFKWFLVHKWGDDLKTSDIRKGEVHLSNWNSPFEDQGAARRGFNMSDFASVQNQLTNQLGSQSWAGGSMSSFMSAVPHWTQGIRFSDGGPGFIR